jgi:hypothetical protein
MSVQPSAEQWVTANAGKQCRYQINQYHLPLEKYFEKYDMKNLNIGSLPLICNFISMASKMTKGISSDWSSS